MSNIVKVRSKTVAKSQFRNILPKTYKNKSEGYYNYGWNDRLPLEIIEAINNSGVAKKAAKKYAEYIAADGFVSPVASSYKVNRKETGDKVLEKIATSFAYFDAVAYHIKRKGDGAIGEVTVAPIHKIRKSYEGHFMYNPTIGTEKFEKSKWETLQPFQGTVASMDAMAENVAVYGGRGEIFYVFDGNPFDSDVYAIPDFLAAFEDLKTSAELIKMDYEAVLNGFVLGGVMTFVGVDDKEEDDMGKTDRDYVLEEMAQFTGLRKNNDGLTSRFGVFTNFVETAEQIPQYTAADPKPILEASDKKRDTIERSICRLWGINPVLMGYEAAAVLGNDKAIEQAKADLRDVVNPIQRLITFSFQQMYGTAIDWTISEFGKEVNIPSVGDKILNTLNQLSPLLATKVIDMIPQDILLDALGIPANSDTPNQTQTTPNEQQ